MKEEIKEAMIATDNPVQAMEDLIRNRERNAIGATLICIFSLVLVAVMIYTAYNVHL